jgi:hypothetical protein
VEYVMLMAVAISIGLAFKKKFSEFLINSPNSLVSQSLNGFKAKFQSDSSGRYRYFPLKR